MPIVALNYIAFSYIEVQRIGDGESGINDGMFIYIRATMKTNRNVKQFITLVLQLSKKKQLLFGKNNKLS